MSQLGVLPLAWLIPAAIVTGAGMWAWKGDLFDFMDEPRYPAYPEPAPPPAPPAPQTREQMTDPARWWLEMPAATTARWSEWEPLAHVPSPSARPANPDALYLALALGGAALLVVLT